MTTNEKWNKIVALHKQYLNSPESKVQNVWENIFVEILGYSRLEGEVDRHRSIQLGSTERVIPDIIVKNQEDDLYVVELKQHNIPFQPEMEKQLFSYLKQLRINIGILICEKMYVYAFDYSKKDAEQLKWQIAFTENNTDGIEFVEKFEKGKFNANKIKLLVFEKNRFNINVNKIIEKITPATIVKALQESLQEDFSNDEINEALSKLSFSVTSKLNQQNQQKNDTLNNNDHPKSVETMKKSIAINLFKKEGMDIPKHCTFASLNKTGLTYWANPEIEVLQSDWWLILNDTKNSILYSLMIPSNTLFKTEFYIRSDRNAININIIYNDDMFTEKQSKISFKPWLVKQISY